MKRPVTRPAYSAPLPAPPVQLKTQLLSVYCFGSPPKVYGPVRTSLPPTSIILRSNLPLGFGDEMQHVAND
jgi:hypothetical protein